MLENLDPDALADLPVQQDEGGIDRSGDPLACLPDQVPHLVEKLVRGGEFAPAPGDRGKLLAWFLALGHGAFLRNGLGTT